MTTFNGIELTEEQDLTIDCIASKEDTAIQAPAGSGKTFTLEAAAYEMLNRKGVYLAFNKAIAESAKQKFSNNVECRTGHSIAFGQKGWDYKDRISKITGTLIAKSTFIGDTSAFPTPTSKGYIILDTIRRFSYSADHEILEKHVPKIKGPYDESQMPQIRKDIIPWAKNVWEEMIDKKGKLPITHDTYVKLWQLDNPVIRKDFILFDEFQDANPVILDIVMRQKHAQKIYVGDKFQQIYGWRGAVNALDVVVVTHRTFITQSFRFGNEIADMANQILSGYMPKHLAPPPIRGLESKKGLVSLDPIDDPDVIICRTNAGVISNVFKYLEADEKKVYVQGGVNQMMLMLKGARDLQEGRRTYCADLALFNTWEEVLECSETESGMELRSFVKMIKDHGIPKLIEALSATSMYASGADITLTTAHKAKGLEWNTVKLYGDFVTPPEDKPMDQSEINLLYVAATRALHTLDISSCAACHPETIYEAKNMQPRVQIEKQY